MPIYEDLANLPEDERIDRIGREVTQRGAVVAILTDDEIGKSERYIAKLLQKFPGVRVMARLPGIVPGTVTIKVGPMRG